MPEKTKEGWEEFYWAYAVMGKPNMPPAPEVPYRAMTAGNFSLFNFNNYFNLNSHI